MEATKSVKKGTVGSQSMERLFAVGAHFGFSKSRRHPSTKPFIFGVKNNVEIFDLEKTQAALEKAKEVMRSLGAAGSSVLFVGGKSEARAAVKAGAETLGMPYVAGRWIGGTLTNFPEIKKRVMKLGDLLTQKEKGELGKYTKKERLLIDREIENLKTYFEGLTPMKDLPKALFVVDSKREGIAIAEAHHMNIPVIGLCGSDCNLKDVEHAIPANDASTHSIAFFVNELAAAYKEGKEEKKA